MVRGRKVRNTTICTRNNAKNQKVLHNKLCGGENISKTTTITDFFKKELQVQDPELIKELLQDVKPLRAGKRRHFATKIAFENYVCLQDDNLITESKNEAATPKTPIQNKTIKMASEKSPPTPHRIELRSEIVDVEDLPEIPPEVQKKDKVLPPKSRKKLTNILQTTDNHKLTEYFPVRRSVRKTEKTVLEEKARSIEMALRNNQEEGLQIHNFEGKGRGIIASRHFSRGDFVVEYVGDLISVAEANKREEMYAQDQNTGCYMYYFKHQGHQYCVDATAESNRVGRLVNHSRNGNLITRTLMIDNRPRLVLIAREDISPGTELTYDYGDRSKEALKHHPWLAY